MVSRNKLIEVRIADHLLQIGSCSMRKNYVRWALSQRKTIAASSTGWLGRDRLLSKKLAGFIIRQIAYPFLELIGLSIRYSPHSSRYGLIHPLSSRTLADTAQDLFRSKGKDKDSIVKHYSLTSVTAFVKLFFVLLAVSILIIPVFILMWGPDTKAAVSATVLISVLVFSTMMTLFTQATVQGVLVGTAA